MKPPLIHRRGAAAIEAAIVLSLLSLLSLGVMEYGRALMVNQMIVNAAREGARYAAKPNATDQTFNNHLDAYMLANGFAATDYSHYVTVSIGGTVQTGVTVSNAPSKSDLTIQVSISNAQASWGGIMSKLSSSRQFVAEVDIRKE